MTNQTIDTDRVAASISILNAVNGNIDAALDTLRGEAKKLDSHWSGVAGEAARSMMYQLLSYGEPRREIVQSYSNLLEKQVNPGYISAEKVNTKLADKFK